jgi:type II secretory ATPase GspE/PulE/Tfp pilus assembly ATPase PilB-like protein
VASDSNSASPIAKASIDDFKSFFNEKEQYPLEFMENYSVIKLRETDDAVHVGLCDPSNYALIENLVNFHKKRVVFHEVDKSELASYLGGLLSKHAAADGGGLAPNKDERLILDKLANDAPIVNLVNSIMIDAIRREASDIHFEASSNNVVVRYRIDGYLHTVRRIEKERFPAISSRLKIMANLNIMEKRLPQDGRITVHIGDDMIDLRVSIIPIVDGESIVLRLFNKKKTPLDLDQLGLDEGELKLLRGMFKITHGLVLATGPTGSGKTTSLNAILREIRSEHIKIITIEDPVEYVTDGIDQIQTNERIGLTFDSILRRVLRQDPDVIMVGEIRDSATAELSIRAALTGHLVFSTLHTKDSISVITRLKNMGIEPYLICAVLKGSIAQRLVRRVCDGCKTAVRLAKRDRTLFEDYGVTEPKQYKGKGCKACNGTGYRGRTGVFELFVKEDAIEDMILKNGRDTEIKTCLESAGMKSLMASGLEKVAAGETTIEELERVLAE